MKVETFIKRYAEKHTEPDQKYCPLFGMRWTGRKNGQGYTKIYMPNNGKIYVNETPKEITKSYNGWTTVNTLSPRSYGYEGVYAKNIRHDILEVAYVAMSDGSRGKEGEIRKWVYRGDHRGVYGTLYRRYFINKADMKPYNVNGERIHTEEDGRYYNKWLVRELNSITSYGRLEPARLSETLKEFTGIESANIGWRGGNIRMEHLWTLSLLIKKTTERKRSDLSIKLAEYVLPEKEYENNTVEFEIVDDTYAVFRMFVADDHYDYTQRRYITDGKAKERCRVFISDAGKPSVLEKKIGSKEWNVVSKSIDSIMWYRNNGEKVGFDKLTEWKPLKWNLDVVLDDKASAIATVKAFVDVLRHPIVEKLYKMGYTHLAKHLIGGEINATLKEMFFLEKINEKKNVYKALGVNKYVLEIVDSYYNRSIGHSGNRQISVRDLKEIFGKNDISDLSKETIDMYSDGIAKCGWRGWQDLIGKSRYYYDRTRFANTVTDADRRLLEKLFRLEKTEEGIINAYGDSRGIYSRLMAENRPEIDWTDFRHLADVVNLHDNLQALMNVQEAEQRRLREMKDEERRKELEKKFKKLQEDRIEKFECVGEDYSIVVPHNLSEITSEGQTLRHCVGGYLERHAQGNTNIVFLRKNSDPDTSFYTIEVTPNDYVEQIHGMCNCWLGNNPDAISFVWKWINDRGLRCEKYKLLNTGAGYGRGSSEVSETYLTA